MGRPVVALGRTAAAVAAVVAVALVVAAAALAGRFDPQRMITPEDQARAKAMLLRKADIGEADLKASSAGGGIRCRANDQSGLTLTGEAKSPTFIPLFSLKVDEIDSQSRVYASEADATAAWRSASSSANLACVEAQLRRALRQAGSQLVSFRKLPFPGVAARTLVYRATVSDDGQRPFDYVDGVALGHSRAIANLLFTSAVSPPDKAYEAKLARVVARRMATALSS
jgi:hypothetical protein